ncbi:diguanylate cyclase (GGDEF)-like protein/PAS domain S-box-containing protein [Evansella vedderi]|uniref:Diguanylate cyclase (GGDEF)-like protein/PAS domain S-box-containing protein n=1 Tax=Evansella vedderi TaxID=38282 RepID=A0ABT9ZZU2_9BACI|nr:EAL domain-containing protein [Evansella vedderi]MDQ0256756.1 diguanylate cyclase (GGDEF)-like protein/PAS domain S-box-containing protein [Evansella vedderi]
MNRKEPEYIAESKERYREKGMDPNVIPAPKKFLTEEELSKKRKSYREILSVVSFFSNKLLDSLKGTPILVVISDSDGYLLDLVGDETIKSTVENFGIKVGSLFTQEDTGTNVVSLALQHKEPISLIGENHYHTFLHEVACYGAAFHYTDEDNLLGSICLMLPITFENSLFLTMLSQVVDSIERELLLRKQNKKLNILNQIMLSKTRNGIIITDKNGITIEFNGVAQKILNQSRRSIIGKKIFNSHTTGDYFKLVLEKQVKFENEELKFTNDRGEQIVCLFDAQPIYEEGVLIGAFGQFRDITERFLMEEKYNYLAYHDDLTDLPNRRYIKKEMETIIKSNKVGNKRNVAILLLDLDRFKVINDTFGHSKADLLLVEVTKRLLACLGKNDKLARIGGDEFIFLLKDYHDNDYVTEVANRILAQFKLPFTVDAHEFHTTVSIGIAVYPDQILSVESFMIQADNAMYEAKTKGKNRYAFYSLDKLNHSIESWKMETDLRNALEKDEFILHYQPQFCNKSGSIIGVEALIRWNHPKHGLIYPDKFIRISEETGLITEIGEWVIKQACIQNKQWQDEGGKPIKVAVNLSTQQFFRPNLVVFLKEVLEQTKLDPEYLVLEITESMAVDFDYSIKVLRELKDLGIGISIDDFGTGYSSLNYLKKFPLDYLKIDRTFVRDIMNDDNAVNIVKTIITLAHNLNLKVIGEGVETEEQLKLLKEYNCDNIQGFLFSKPVPAEEFRENLRSLF